LPVRCQQTPWRRTPSLPEPAGRFCAHGERATVLQRPCISFFLPLSSWAGPLFLFVPNLSSIEEGFFMKASFSFRPRNILRGLTALLLAVCTLPVLAGMGVMAKLRKS